MTTKIRGCGTRKTDSLYIESELSPEGVPIEECLIDPPIPTDSLNILWSRNFQLFEKDGITHLIDWVGEQYYESPWDFIEECRVKGASRRAPKNFPFEKLTLGKSMIFFAHKKAIYDGKFCPKNLFKCNSTPDSVASTRHLSSVPNEYKKEAHWWVREIGDVDYDIYGNYDHEWDTKKLKAGLFMRLPVTTITFVRPKDQHRLDELQKKNINFKIAEE